MVINNLVHSRIFKYLQSTQNKVELRRSAPLYFLAMMVNDAHAHAEMTTATGGKLIN